MNWMALRTTALAGLATLAFAISPAQAQAPSNRLALVIGEAGYNNAPLPTAANDATLVARTLVADGFDVTELHELNTPDLAANYQSFIAKVKAAPPGVAVTVYLAGLGVNVGCDDYLLPIDARIQAAADVPRIALSMTRVMRDLEQTSSQVRLVMLDGARPIPPSVSSVAFPRGLMPLHPPTATTFAISAEIHDFEDPPKPSDANDAYATAFTAAIQQPLGDLETTMRETRLIAHQTTAGGQTPWQETNPAMPPFTFPLGADATSVEAAMANLPSATAPLAGLDAQTAYWAAIWRNSTTDYQAYLAAFSTTAPAELTSRVKQLLDLLLQPNPQCQAQAAPPAPPATLIAGPLCPDGFVAEDGYNGAYCHRLLPPPVIDCPPGYATIATDDGMACRPFIAPPTLVCPPRYFAERERGWCRPEHPPVYCPEGFRPLYRYDELVCVHMGPPPPFCPQGLHPARRGEEWICIGNPPPPIECREGRGEFRDGRWICIDVHPRCPANEIPHWVDGREVCGPARPPIGCPRDYVRRPDRGGICVPLGFGGGGGGGNNGSCVVGSNRCPPPIGTGGAHPIVCANGQPFVPGKGCGLGQQGGNTLRCANGSAPLPGKGCVGGSATTDTHCPAGQTYVLGKGCVAGSTTTDTHCPAGQIYAQGKGCVGGSTTTDTHCPAGQIYTPGKGCAAPSIVGPQTCPPGEFKKADGTCGSVAKCANGQPVPAGGCPAAPATCPSGTVRRGAGCEELRKKAEAPVHSNPAPVHNNPAPVHSNPPPVHNNPPPVHVERPRPPEPKRPAPPAKPRCGGPNEPKCH